MGWYHGVGIVPADAGEAEITLLAVTKAVRVQQRVDAHGLAVGIDDDHAHARIRPKYEK
ncbi:hypothetical protein D3C72_2458820 [compost metagenome]